MACATASDLETANWTASFPTNLNSVRNSNIFTKKLAAIAISNITYMRAIFPDSAYGARKLGDLDLKILSDNSSCPEACQVITWMKGLFDAIDHKYLQQMMLGIHDTPGDHENVIETYIFRFEYIEGVSVTCNGTKLGHFDGYDSRMTKVATVAMLRTLLCLTQTLEPLPDNCYLTMKLVYYDNVTPVDYEPPGFVPANTDLFYFNGIPQGIKLGHVSTAFHSVNVSATAQKEQFDPRLFGSMQLQSCNTSENSFFGGIGNLDKLVNGKDYHINGKDTSSVMHPSCYTNMENGINTATEAENDLVQCPCGFQEDDGKLMVACQKCEHWQHAVCFGMVDEFDVPEIHLCNLCYIYDKGDFKPHDKDFYELSPRALQAVCKWRRALSCVYDMKTVTSSTLAKKMNIKNSVAVNIIERMQYKGYVTAGKGRNRSRKSVNKSLIKKHGFPKYVTGPVKSLSEDGDDEQNEKQAELTAEDEQPSDPAILPALHGQKRFCELFEDEQNEKQAELTAEGEQPSDPAILPALHGQKRFCELFEDFDLETSVNPEPEWDGEERRKHKKASTCKNGIRYTYNQNEYQDY